MGLSDELAQMIALLEQQRRGSSAKWADVGSTIGNIVSNIGAGIQQHRGAEATEKARAAYDDLLKKSAPQPAPELTSRSFTGEGMGEWKRPETFSMGTARLPGEPVTGGALRLIGMEKNLPEDIRESLTRAGEAADVAGRYEKTAALDAESKVALAKLNSELDTALAEVNALLKEKQAGAEQQFKMGETEKEQTFKATEAEKERLAAEKRARILAGGTVTSAQIRTGGSNAKVTDMATGSALIGINRLKNAAKNKLGKPQLFDATERAELERYLGKLSEEKALEITRDLLRQGYLAE